MKNRIRNSQAAPSVPRSHLYADGALVTKAALRAARRLALSNAELARILGLSESTIARMTRGAYALAPERKSYELALLLVRLCGQLEAIVGSDAAAAQTWLRSKHNVLGGTPMARIETIAGLTETLAYLDTRRASV